MESELLNEDIKHEWFYEENGTRKGPVFHANIEEFIASKKLSYGSLIWCKDFQDWTPIERTVFADKIKSTSPPPLSGGAVKNAIVWILAFAPLIGLFLEILIAGMLWGEVRGMNRALNGDLWYITLALNIILSVIDEKQLQKAGHDTSKFKGFVWLVPVYLYQRAYILKQNKAYFITWIVAFILILIG